MQTKLTYGAPAKCQELFPSARDSAIHEADEVFVGTGDKNKTFKKFHCDGKQRKNLGIMKIFAVVF